MAGVLAGGFLQALGPVDAQPAVLSSPATDNPFGDTEPLAHPARSGLYRLRGIPRPLSRPVRDALSYLPDRSLVRGDRSTLRIASGDEGQCTTPVSVHRPLQRWIDTDLWTAYGVSPWKRLGGIQADGVDAEATADVVRGWEDPP